MQKHPWYAGPNLLTRMSWPPSEMVKALWLEALEKKNIATIGIFYLNTKTYSLDHIYFALFVIYTCKLQLFRFSCLTGKLNFKNII